MSPQTIHDHNRLFKLDAVRYELLEKVLDNFATDHDLKNIMYIGLRRGIRWGARDHRVPPKAYKQDRFDIHLVFDGATSLWNYNGGTGKRLTK